MVGWRGAASSCGQRGLLFLLVVLLSDHVHACWKGSQAIHVIAVAVSQDYGRYRLWCDLANVIEQLLAAGFRRLCVNDDDAACADDNGAVAAATLDPVDVRL